MFGRPNPRKLKDQAQEAVTKGKHKKALEAYLELERIEASNGDWSRRAGEMYKNLEQAGDAIVSWTRAVDRYAEAGFLVKAIAVCQMILRLDPEHTDSQRRLVALNAARGIHVPEPELDTQESAPDAVAAAAGSPPPMEAGRTRRRTLPPGMSLADISLKDAVPGSQAVIELADEGSSDKVFEIPLDIELDHGFADITDESSAEAESPRTEALSHTPLFSDLPAASLHQVIAKVRLIELAAGEVLFRQGDPGRELFVVAEGEVAVVQEGPPKVHLTTLGEGAFFGEVALVTSQPRTATIEATQASTVLGLDRDVVGELVEQEPVVLKVMLRFLRDRLLDNLVRSSPLFAPFGDSERRDLAARFRFLEALPGTVLILQGHRSKGMYILLAGTAEVYRHDDGETRRLATLGPGDLAGEMSLLANDDAVATVKTTSKVLAIELPATTFREVIMTHPQVLMYISDVADERKRAYQQIASGEADYAETHLELI